MDGRARVPGVSVENYCIIHREAKVWNSADSYIFPQAARCTLTLVYDMYNYLTPLLYLKVGLCAGYDTLTRVLRMPVAM